MRRNSLARVASLGIIALMLCGTPTAMAKTFRINIVADPAQMDPITYWELISGRIMRNMYEGFTATADDGRNIPALAVRWEPLPYGPGFRFSLRKGVLFHSGRPLTAKDVKYRFEELLWPGSKGGLNASYLNGVVGAKDLANGTAKSLAGITIVDDYTIDIALTKPDVLFPIDPFHFMDSGIVAEQGPDWMTKVSAGTGPYAFKAWHRSVGAQPAGSPVRPSFPSALPACGRPLPNRRPWPRPMG